MKQKRKLSLRKYDGDDDYSWAVFYADEIKGIRGVVFYGQALPLVCGLSRDEASYHKKLRESE